MSSDESTAALAPRIPLRVLMVEDDEDFARLTVLRLGKAHPGGFEVETRHTCADAVARLAEGEVDVILLDLWLPDNEGLFTLSAVHASAPGVPLVILSAADDDEASVEAIRQGAQDYLVKQRVDGRVLGRVLLQARERHRWIGQFQRHLREARSEETRLRRIVDQIADGILVVRKDGTVRFANPAAGRFFQQPPDRLVGSAFGLPLVAARGSAEVDLHVGGRHRVAELRAVDVTWDEEPAKMLALRDVTERKRAEAANALLAAIVDSSNDAVIGQDLEGRITTWNPGAQRLYGYTETEAIGRPFAELFPADRQGDLVPVHGTIERGKSTGSIESLALRKDGSTVEITLRASPIRSEHSGFIGTSAVIEDISERKALERMRNDVLAMLTHDMKTPLSAILGFSELLRETELTGRQADFLDRVDANARAAVTLASNFIDVARIESGLLDLAIEETRLNEIVLDAVRRQESVARLRHVTIETRLADLPPLRLDARLIDRAVTNLLSNAIKFSPREGRVVVSTFRDHGGIGLAVDDQGPGVPESDRQHLFQRFSLLRGSNRESSGLGLFIVRTVVEAQGGTVALEAANGGGACFVVRFPARLAVK